MHVFKALRIVSFIAALLVLISFMPEEPSKINDIAIKGAWQYGPDNNRTVMIVVDRVFAVATYDLPEKKFISSYGGTWRLDKDKWIQTIEWNSQNADQVGKEVGLDVALTAASLIVKQKNESWSRLESTNSGDLAGVWVITGNFRDGQPSKRSSPFYPRRTMKVLGGGRFQWIAYNVETKEFQNTGGGTYTATNGTYTETIEFFTKTAESIGKKLTFEYSFVDGDWRHKGEKSTGGPMDEIWSRRETLESEAP